MKLLIPLVFLLFYSCSSSVDSNQKVYDHHTPKSLVNLDSEYGNKLFEKRTSKRFETLKKYWRPQEKNFCGVCSIVISTNFLNSQESLDQKNFFTTKVSEKTPFKMVRKMGLTLNELANNAKLHNPYRIVEEYNSLDSDEKVFQKHLLENNYRDDMTIIVNFSRQSLAGTGMLSGHHSIVTDYSFETDQVLILEVNSERGHFWVDREALFTAMYAIDPVSKLNRGWIVIKNKFPKKVLKLRKDRDH